MMNPTTTPSNWDKAEKDNISGPLGNPGDASGKHRVQRGPLTSPFSSQVAVTLAIPSRVTTELTPRALQTTDDSERERSWRAIYSGPVPPVRLPARRSIPIDSFSNSQPHDHTTRVPSCNQSPLPLCTTLGLPPTTAVEQKGHSSASIHCFASKPRQSQDVLASLAASHRADKHGARPTPTDLAKSYPHSLENHPPSEKRHRTLSSGLP
ncbi:hypothetical protein EDB81DRAFT_503506 [Dactylonectria macrodidyma]|uniref:Uncharacterized protein n=1 Tax=Dactylonectria macrodidyma TaxID=307937 RepID=A0A9P9J4J8_9HYPO|nr:hypothetical protein EDB81DRAFT_503506 [Dactylonectria macrodidyma]